MDRLAGSVRRSGSASDVNPPWSGSVAPALALDVYEFGYAVVGCGSYPGRSRPARSQRRS